MKEVIVHQKMPRGLTKGDDVCSCDHVADESRKLSWLSREELKTEFRKKFPRVVGGMFCEECIGGIRQVVQ